MFCSQTSHLSPLLPDSPIRENWGEKPTLLIPPRWMPPSGWMPGAFPQVPLSWTHVRQLVPTREPSGRGSRGWCCPDGGSLPPRPAALTFSLPSVCPRWDGQRWLAEQVVLLASEAEIFYLLCACAAPSRQGLHCSRATEIKTWNST